LKEKKICGNILFLFKVLLKQRKVVVKILMMLFLLLGLSLFRFAESEAALVVKDLTTVGGGQITYDTATGLSWLDVINTYRISYGDVIAGYGGYTTSQGFRFATNSEVATLIKHAGITEGRSTTGDWNNINNTRHLISLLGVTYTDGHTFLTNGYVADPDRCAGLAVNDIGEYDAYSNILLRDIPGYFERTGAGSFLVKDSSYSLADGILGYWRFDGNGVDASDFGRDLKLNDTTFVSTGLTGQALSLAGNINSYATRTTNDTSFDVGSGDFTIQVWVNYNTTANEQVAIEKWTGPSGPGWTLTKLSSNVLRFHLDTATYIDSGVLNIPTNQWHQYIVRRCGSSLQMFYDGTLVAFNNSIGTIAGRPSTNPLLLGKRNDSDGRVFATNGLIDEVAFWNRTLTDGELTNLYNGGKGNSIGVAQTLFGDSLKTSPSYEFSLEQNTQKSFSVQLMNPGSVARTATVEIINPHSGITDSLTQQNPISIAPGTTHTLPIVIDAGTMPIGVYDDQLLKVMVDDGSTLYSTIKLTIVQQGVANLPDLAIGSGDIRSTTNADGTVTLTASIHNKGSLSAANVQVRFFELDAQLGDTVIVQVPVNGLASTSLTIPMAESGDHLIRVVIDPLGTIQELGKSNNEASQIVHVVGATASPQGNILVTGSLPATVYAGDVFTLSGTAVYDIYAGGVRYTNYAVKGGSVQVTIKDTAGLEWTYGDVHTDINGNLVKHLQAPATPGTYRLLMSVTDNSFIGKRELTFRVVEKPVTPPPPPAPPVAWQGGGSWTFVSGSGGSGGSGGSWTWTWSAPPPSGTPPQTDLRIFSEDIHFSNNNPAEGSEITIFAQLHYWATNTNFIAEDVPVNFYVTYPGTPKIKIGQTALKSMSVGAPDYGSRYVYASWKNEGQGIYIVEAEIDPAFHEANMLNNTATRAIVVGTMESHSGAIQGQVGDEWGGVESAVIELYDSTSSTLISSTMTDKTGHYVIDALPVDDYQVHIVAPNGYNPDATSKPAQVVDQQITIVDFSLTQHIDVCGDLDHDGDVDATDRNIIRAAFKTKTGGQGFIEEADYDNDGDIDYSDYQLWYECYKVYIAN
jgi:hypothetical protein